MRVALVQTGSPADETRAERLTRVERLCAEARGSDLIVLPELWLTGYFSFDRYEADAEPLLGPSVTAARSWARAGQCHINLGSFLERDEKGRLFNTSVLIAPSGQIAYAYRKIHLFGLASREPELLTAGTEVVSAPTAHGQIGAAICYDLRFPELWRGLVDGGAELVIVPAAWPARRVAHWQLFTTCRAVEQQIFVVACNAAGTQGGVEMGGRSRVVSPMGDVLTEAGVSDGVTVVDINMADVAVTRDQYPALRDRRLPTFPMKPPRPGVELTARAPFTDMLQ